MQTTATPTLINGIDVESLGAFIQTIQTQPELAQFEWRAKNRWLGGTHNQSQIKDFRGNGIEDTTREAPFILDNGEPRVLAGQDEGANPVEFLLHALLGCMTTSTVAHAAARGIEIHDIQTEIKGDMDVRGFAGVSNGVRKGYQAMEVKMRIKSSGDAETLKKLYQMSPVFDTLANPLPIKVNVVVEP